VLHLLGQLMREVIVGVGENVHLRSEQRAALRITNDDKDTGRPNPLKGAAGVDDTLASLLFADDADAMSAVDALREALVEIKAHQQTMFAALRTALADYLGRLDPDEIETKYTNGKRGVLMNAANKLKYWDLYKDLFQVVTQQSPGQLPQLFAEDLTRAYEHESVRSGGSDKRKPQAKAAN
jgi:type VI secretion system FHA domain protein